MLNWGCNAHYGNSLEKIDGSQSKTLANFSLLDIEKVDGEGDKTLIAQDKHNLTIHKKIDGRGCHRFVNFGTVEVLDRVDGEGDRWFINCSRVHIDKRKDGGGTLYLVDSPCFMTNKSGAGSIVWIGEQPIIASHGITDQGHVICDPHLKNHTFMQCI